jgi:hypothetical protein
MLRCINAYKCVMYLFSMAIDIENVLEDSPREYVDREGKALEDYDLRPVTADVDVLNLRRVKVAAGRVYRNLKNVGKSEEEKVEVDAEYSESKEEGSFRLRVDILGRNLDTSRIGKLFEPFKMSGYEGPKRQFAKAVPEEAEVVVDYKYSPRQGKADGIALIPRKEQ